jgi:hypothetical protein
MNPTTGYSPADPAGPSIPWRDRQMAPAWPSELLEQFCLRMSSQGMCVSRVLMIGDRRYALEQLAHAQKMPDEALRWMALQLFRHFEARQSGIAGMH